jgi:hypothetical protein
MRFEHAVLSLLLALASIGCQGAVGQALPKDLAGNDPDAQLAFWHTLPTRKVVSNDEAFHALLLFVDSQDTGGDYIDRMRQLKTKKLLPADFQEPAEFAAHRGTLAVVLANVLSIRGGVTMHLFGAQPRYALREMIYAGLFPPSSPQEVFSGAQFLGIIGRAEDYQRDSIQGTAVMNADDAGNGLLNAVPPIKVH